MDMSIDTPHQPPPRFDIDGDTVVDAMAVRLGRALAQVEMLTEQVRQAADVVTQQRQRIEMLEQSTPPQPEDLAESPQ